MFLLVVIFSFVFGVVLGSFIDASAERWGQDKSILGRSHCVACGYILRWKHLIPIVSFLALKGKCANCGITIPKRHLFVETLTGVIFVLIFLSLPLAKYIFVVDFNTTLLFIFNLIFLWAIASAILIILISDARFYIIPDVVSLPATGLMLLFALFIDYIFPNVSLFADLNQGSGQGILFSSVPSFPESLLGAIVGSLFFFSISFVSQGRWMGWGDGKLAMFLGAFFGWPFVVPVVFLAFILGSVAGVFLMLKKEATMKSLLPFGLFLGISAILFLIVQNLPSGQTFKFFASSFFAF